MLARIRENGAIPRHIAIIMDGNGRWARERNLPRPLGHRSGMKSVREVVEGAIETGVEVLSLFAFSQENWQRPVTEIQALMSLLEEYIAREAEELAQQGVRVQVLGDLARLTQAAAGAAAKLIATTAHNDKLVLNLFISYGSRAEIVRAAQLLVEDVRAGRMSANEIDEEAIAARLYTMGVPDPDLLIRTSGEQRLSNFMLWQAAYAELYMSPVLWPNFRRQELFEAILDFQSRDRRFGRVTA
ncbi:MAG: isoprenyl transferase [Gemmatimonadota bacterium]